MSPLKKNALANYAGQVYASVCSILFLPYFLKYLGAEAYGLVGFFVVLQQWFILLDMGLSPTLSREISRYGAGAVTATELARLVRTIEWIFGCLAVLCFIAVWNISPLFAEHWLNPEGLAEQDVVGCLRLCGAMIAMRWLSGLYRSGLVGLERHVLLNVFGIAFATLRTFGALAMLVLWRADVVHYFVFQVFISGLELGVMCAVFYRVVPMKGSAWKGCLRSLEPVKHLTGMMAYMTLLWTVVSQMDKLLLSHFLSLKEFGFFSSAIILAGAILLISGPLTQALHPRLAGLAARGDEQGLLALFSLGMQFISALAFSLAGMMIFFGSTLLLLWARSSELAMSMYLVLGLFAMGNAFVSLLALAFQLQFARGETRLHALGTTLFAVFWIPAIPLCATRYGAQGVAVAWLIGNACFLLGWTPLALKRIFATFDSRWIFKDVLVIAIVSMSGWAALAALPFTLSGYAGLFLLFGLGCCVFALSLMAGNLSRGFIFSQFRSVFNRWG